MSTKFEQKPKAIGSHCKWCGNKEEDHLEGGKCPDEVINTGAAPGEPIEEDHVGWWLGPEGQELQARHDAAMGIEQAIQIAEMLPKGDEVRTGLLHSAAKIWNYLNSPVAVIKSEVTE